MNENRFCMLKSPYMYRVKIHLKSNFNILIKTYQFDENILSYDSHCHK